MSRSGSFLITLLAGGALAASACDRGPTAPLPAAEPAAVSWHAVMLEIVAAHPWTPPHAARVYAYLGVAQYEALHELEAGQGKASTVAARAAVAEASAAVMRELYPSEEARVARAIRNLAPRPDGSASRAEIAAGVAAGSRAAARLIERARSDHADMEWDGELPTGPGMWFSSSGEPPVAPMAGEMLPWSMAAVETFDPGPPPAFGSPEFMADLAEVRAFSDERTPEMTEIARFYEYGPGTPSPAGQYVELASELILRYGLDEVAAARTLAMLGMAMADAGIAAWHAKYKYNLIRPSQVDPGITMVVALPNFPAYPSGHSTFSGAAEGVLSAVFPAEAAEIRAFAEENGVSRIYGGVHFSFDNTVGLEMGRRIAPHALSTGGRLAPAPLLAAR